MAQVIQFEENALASLRERLGAANEANQDLIAFARGHAGAVSSIHAAVLAAMEADSFENLLRVVTHDWPSILGLDAVAIALLVGNRGFRADFEGVQAMEPQMLRRAIHGVDEVTMQAVERGHPLFGRSAGMVRAEALIRIDSEYPFPTGLIALGQQARQIIDPRHGGELLLFLGHSLAAMIRRCVTAQQR